MLLGPNERIFKKPYAFELMNIAQNDFLTAQVLSGHPEVRRETVLLHCQQAIEKTLKAVICANGKPVPFTHEIVLLADRLAEDLPPGGYALHDLSPYASLMRNEEGKFEITAEDIAHMMDTARQVLEWAKERVK
jgi:HEPN domain-containing protein